MKLILASSSPRRKELLDSIGLSFTVIPSNSLEVIDESLSINKAIEEVAYAKALDVYANNNVKDDLVLAADTVVVVDGKVFGKPKDKEEAIIMLQTLSNRTHEVITGVCFYSNNNIYKTSVVTKVTFDKLDLSEILEYISLENVYDKAGAYAIQGLARKYISSISGSYENVMGLPIHTIYQYLKTNFTISVFLEVKVSE